MAENDNQVPDMVAAGVESGALEAPRLRGGAAYLQLPSGVSNSLVGALGGQQQEMGAVTPSLLSAMLPQPMTAGQVYSAALAGGVSGMRGQPNPVQAQYEQQVRQQQGAANTAYRFMERQRAQEEKRGEAQKVLSEGLLKSENPNAQKVGAQGLSDYYGKTTGRRILPDWFIQTAKLSDAERDQIDGYILSRATDEQIIAANPKFANLSPGYLAAERRSLEDPVVRAKRGYKSPDALLRDKAVQDREVAEAGVATWRAQNKDVDDKTLPYLAQYVQQHGGIPLIGLDPSNPVHQRLKAEGLAWAQAQAKANDTAWQQLDISRGQLEEAQRAHRVGESQKERELRIKEATEGGFGKPLSAEATNLLTGIGRLRSSVGEIDRIAGDPEKRKTVDSYIGPYASRTITAQQWAPGGVLGKVPDEVVDLQQNIATMKNYTIKLITGAALSVQEAERIMKELPDLSLPPDMFWRRYDNTKRKIADMEQTIYTAIVRGDRRALALWQELNGAPPAAAPGPLNPAKAGAGWGKAERVR
ncbi:MAG TPA: hypothetical protein VGX03_15075 [Candidatus Binatia bacterium]|jgi:hypothetical protein|nr:hypothetical protein [Candidatus Binatia bacterium]